MGFLRKVGRKVNRTLVKIFGKKLGNLIGGIGLSMVMWGGAKVLFPNLTSAISQQMTNLKAKVFGTPTDAIADVKKVLPDDVIETAKNADVVGGATGNIMDTSTFKSGDPINIVEGAGIDTAAVSKAAQSTAPIDTITGVRGNILDTSTFKSEPINIVEGAGIDTAAVTEAGKTATPIDIDTVIADQSKNFAQRTKDYFMDGDFVPDVAKGAVTSVVTAGIMGEPEEPFRSAGVASQPLMEAAQGNYMRDVGPSAMAATGMTRMPSFQELSQQTLYGTGSPSWMAQFYQPLATPQGIG